MFASTTSSNRARTSAGLPAASSSSVGSSGESAGRRPDRFAGPEPLAQEPGVGPAVDRWLPMMWPRVCRTVHSPPPGSASQSASDSGASAPWSSQRATAIACSAGIAGPSRCARTVAAAVGDRCDRGLERLVDAVDPVAHIDLVDVGREPRPAALERRIGDRQQVGDDTPASGTGRRRRRDGAGPPGRSPARSGDRASAKRTVRRLASD